MKKIFKYNYNPDTGEVCMPLEISVLRAEYVKDAFYDCHSIWGIVDTSHESINQIIKFQKYPYSLAKTPIKGILNRHELGIKEKQTVHIPGKPEYVTEEDGKIVLYYRPDYNYVYKNWNISFYKTGQVIDEDLSKAEYLGTGKLWIIQELCLYCFLTNP